MIIKNLENKIKLVIIVTSCVIVGCVIISVSSIMAATNMVIDSQKKSTYWMGTYLFLSPGLRWMRQ